MKVMLVDDEKGLRDALRLIFERAGYEFVGVADGNEALKAFEREAPDVAVLDVMLPGLNGFDLCELLRARSARLPILMLSAKCDVVDRRVGLKLGADDYLAKPFDEEELLLRVRALVRRRDGGGGGPAAAGEGALSIPAVGLEVDTGRRELVVRGERVQLTPKEFAIVELLAGSPGNVFTRDEIVAAVWGEQYCGTSISIPTYVRRIREKIEEDPSEPALLQTVFGFGYRVGG